MLVWVADRSRWALVLGLVAGMLLPGLAQVLRPWIPVLIGLLLFVTAVRVGPKAALGPRSGWAGALGSVLVLQLGMPLAVVAVALGLGVAETLVVTVLILVLAAPSVTGSPNFTIILGHDPAMAMRLMVLGTALLPLTAVPILWLAPAFGGVAVVVAVASKLLGVIVIAVSGGFLVRRYIDPSPDTLRSIDGIAAILLAVVVVGLMSAVGPALADTPMAFLGWLAFAFALNFGLQAATFGMLAQRAEMVPLSVVAGNRNIALFLVALPAEVTDTLLLFIGCYQLPMYLTPMLLRRFYSP